MKSKADKREEANKRQDESNKLTTRQKIDLLDKKYGKGKGAERQRARLNKKLEKEHGRKNANHKSSN